MSGKCEKCSEHCLECVCQSSCRDRQTDHHLILEYELREEIQVMVKNIINMISYQDKDINEQFTILIHLLVSRLLSNKRQGIDLWDQVMKIIAKEKEIYYELDKN